MQQLWPSRMRGGVEREREKKNAEKNNSSLLSLLLSLLSNGKKHIIRITEAEGITTLVSCLTFPRSLFVHQVFLLRLLQRTSFCGFHRLSYRSCVGL